MTETVRRLNDEILEILCEGELFSLSSLVLMEANKITSQAERESQVKAHKIIKWQEIQILRELDQLSYEARRAEIIDMLSSIIRCFLNENPASDLKKYGVGDWTRERLSLAALVAAYRIADTDDEHKCSSYTEACRIIDEAHLDDEQLECKHEIISDLRSLISLFENENKHPTLDLKRFDLSDRIIRTVTLAALEAAHDIMHIAKGDAYAKACTMASDAYWNNLESFNTYKEEIVNLLSSDKYLSPDEGELSELIALITPLLDNKRRKEHQKGYTQETLRSKSLILTNVLLKDKLESKDRTYRMKREYVLT